MHTLYDLLGARPDDDAEGLKKAFHHTIKAHHPDVNRGDPEAAARTQRIMRAYEILKDADKRAAHDRLLEIDFRRLSATSKRVILTQTIHKLASDLIAVALGAGILLGGYAVFRHASDPSPDEMVVAAAPVPLAAVDTPVEPRGVVAEPPRAEAAIPAPQADKAPMPEETPRDDARSHGGAAEPKQEPARVAEVVRAAEPPAIPNASQAGAVLTGVPALPDPVVIQSIPTPAPPVAAPAAAPTADADKPAAPASSSRSRADVTAAIGAGVRDAKFFRQEGLASYHAGDLAKALTHLSTAIRLNPRYHEAYVDRAIVHYRLRRLDRAFADVAAAKRIAR